jgi:hypothetical protein
MKLPTLNVDVKVNTASMKRDVEEAKKQLQSIGAKGAAFAGGSFGKIGALSSLGGTAGSLAIGAAGIGFAAAAPVMAANAVIESFAAAVKSGTETMKAFSEGKDVRQTGLAVPLASNLAAAGERYKTFQATGGGSLFDTFLGASMNEQGQSGGIVGALETWAQSFRESLKYEAAWWGGILGGKETWEAEKAANIATSGSLAAAQSYMTTEEINRIAREVERLTKTVREGAA